MIDNTTCINMQLPEDVSNFLEMNSDALYIDGEEYFRPAGFWYKKTDKPNVFQVYFNDISKQLNKQ